MWKFKTNAYSNYSQLSQRGWKFHIHINFIHVLGLVVLIRSLAITYANLQGNK